MTSQRIFLVLIGVVAVLNGVARQLLEPGQAYAEIDVPFAFLSIALLYAWYRADSEKRVFRRSRWLNIMMIAAGILAFPYYLIRSRGWTRGAMASAVFIGGIVLYMALEYGGEYAVYLAKSI